MFLRKLTVIVLPLILLLVLCLILPAIDSLQLMFLAPVVKGLLLGVILALLLPLAGASRGREPFAGMLWVPAFLTLGLIICQYAASTGAPMPALIVTNSVDVVLTESLFCGFLFTQCIRTAR